MKIYNVITAKTFRGESYGEPETTSCATQEIAKREFERAVRSELNEHIGYTEPTDEDGKPLTFDVFLEYASEECDFSINDTSFTFDTSDESQTTITIVEGELITE